MTRKSSGLPEVTVEPGRIEDFVNGIYGANKAANRKAYAKGAVIAAIVLGPEVIRRVKKKAR
jgi:hypothetical protein